MKILFCVTSSFSWTMKPIPEELKRRLFNCRRNVSCLVIRKWDIERTEKLRDELNGLNEELFNLLEDDEDVPEDLISKMSEYNVKLDCYLEMLKNTNTNSTSNQTNHSNGDDDLVNNLSGMSIMNSNNKIKTDQLPNFDGKYVNWNSYKVMIENLLINNMLVSEDLKKSMLLKTVKNEPARMITIFIGQNLPLSEIWARICTKYNDPQRAILEIKNELKSIPEIKSENEVDNLKKAKDIVENANLAIDSIQTNAQFYTSNLIQAVANKFYYRAQRKMLAKIKKFSDLVSYIDELYENALQYDYNKIRKDEASKKFDQPKKNLSTAAITTDCCYVCNKNHKNNFECLKNCDVKTVADIIKSKGICYRCLKKGHFSKNCPMVSKISCATCHRKHVTEMHDIVNELFQTKPKEIDNSKPSTSEEANSTAAIYCAEQPENVFIISEVSKHDNRPMYYGSCNGINSRMLLDNGSNISLIDEDLIIGNQNKSNENFTIFSSSPLGGTTTSNQKILFGVRSLEKNIVIELFPVKMHDKNLIIIGTDNLSYFYETQPEFLEIPTIFGTIRYKARRDIAQVCNLNASTIPIIVQSNNESFSDEKTIIESESLKEEFLSKSDRELAELEVKNDLNIDDDEVEDDIQVERKNGGRYEARLPFLSDLRPKCNFDKALSVLNKLLKRLDCKSMRNIYEKQLMAYVENDQAIEVSDPIGYFLPHHPVFRDSISTPLRVVFNGSFGFEAINELLWKGNARGLDVFDHLLRFRKGKFAVTADLSKAFLQVLIHPDDQKYLKFLWKNSDNELKIYQMKVLPFGLVSSPAILTAVTKKLLCEQDLDQIANAIYMDDIIWASDSESILVDTVNKVKDSFKNAGFVMHKVHSNSQILSSKFESEDCIETKVLGTIWNTNNDKISNVIPQIQPVQTKRDLLAIIGKFFDPYGIFDPWKLKLRLLYRTVIKNEWDSPISNEIKNQIDLHLQDANQLSELKMDRCVPSNGEIHGFSDASTSAYGYVVFLKKDDEFHYLFGKSKLVPCKLKTVVELELLAIYELGKILYRIHSIYQNKMTIWSDSKINLCRFNLSPNGQNRKIASQLMKTLKIINDLNISIRHINSHRNPADLFSRIVDTKQFLKLFRFRINSNEFDFSDANLFNVYRISSIAIKNFDYQNSVDDFEKLKSMDQIIDFVKKLLPAGNTANDRWNLIHRLAQYGHDLEEIKLPFIPGEIITIKTRDPNFCPIWIPKQSCLTQALIKEHHESTMHGGIRTTMASIQSKYHIQNLYRLVKKYVFYCELCRKEKRKPIIQPFAPLPSTRTNFAAPFEAICVDFFGPLHYRNNKKFYGLIVTCLVTRMIKIEIVNSMNANVTLTALNNIFLRCGTPLVIYSDNGTSFVRCNKEIQKFFDHLQKISEVDNRRIEWKFSPPNAPWYNGTAERLIAVVKRCLRTLDNEFKSIEDAHNMFLKIESIINNRPIIQNDERWISPFELAYGRKQEPLIKNDLEIGPNNNWLNHLSNIRKKFEKFWKHQYLASLIQSNPPSPTDININDLVLVPSEFRKRKDWPIAKITEAIKSSDGVVRAVKIKFLDNNNEFIRPTNGLVLLKSPGEC